MGHPAIQRKILVVEDELFIRMSAVGMLEDAGFGVRQAKDSAQALRVLAENDDINVLMTDVRMPGKMDGFALVAQVCITYPAIRSIVVSANSSAAQASNAGAFGFVAKPYTASMIVQAVRDTELQGKHCQGAAALQPTSESENLTTEARDQLKQAVESRHGGKATFVQCVPVHEKHGDHTVWDVGVSVFDLRGSSSGAFRAYAWSHELPNGEQQFFAILHSPQTASPMEAVRAAMLADPKAGK